MKKMMKFAAPLFAATLALTACGNGDTAADTDTNGEEAAEETTEEVETLNIQATIFPIVNFTERIGGDFVDVTSIYPVGVDSHQFEPTQQQVVEIARADLFIFNGAGMEPFAESLLDTLADEGVTFVEASAGIELLEGGHAHSHAHGHSHDHAHSHDEEEHDHGHDGHAHAEEDDHEEESHDNHGHGHSHGDYDPHIWLDPIRAISMAENILNALVEKQPANEDYFRGNFETLKEELEELDAAFKEAIENSELNKILVSHAAYGYWSERYGLEQLSVTGLSTTAEPSQQQLAEIIQTAAENNITTILFETTSSPRVARVVQEELDLNVLYLNHLSTVTQEDVDEGRDYFDLMRANIEILKEALNP